MNYSDDELIALINRLLEKLHQADGNNKKGSTVIIYTDAASKLVKDNKATPPDLPPSLSTDKAMVLWKKAQDAGYVDENYQPLISRTQAAILANAIAVQLNIKQRWKVFEKFWNRKNMRNDYYTALYQQQYSDFMDELKKNLS